MMYKALGRNSSYSATHLVLQRSIEIGVGDAYYVNSEDPVL